MFIDIAKIKVKAGDGGDGAVAFHREKYVASGGPDGGDGGRGGDIVLRVDDNLSTLADFRYKRKYTAERGENGRGKRCFGKSAQPRHYRAARHTDPQRGDRPHHGGHVHRRRRRYREGRPRWLGQHAFCVAYAPDSALCKARHTR